MCKALSKFCLKHFLITTNSTSVLFYSFVKIKLEIFIFAKVKMASYKTVSFTLFRYKFVIIRMFL